MFPGGTAFPAFPVRRVPEAFCCASHGGMVRLIWGPHSISAGAAEASGTSPNNGVAPSTDSLS
ncbi:MAG: hypothetical protein A3F68_08600 [Acidobacteria bacterium RIFCSPLOWO2_12_FULL_54_10]|nr:MAG: hypothetical protein A3F68_08600 [Acidobacteria bacterium RIFCSPLOWO2_12_FULL_54_10]